MVILTKECLKKSCIVEFQSSLAMFMVKLSIVSLNVGLYDSSSHGNPN